MRFSGSESKLADGFGSNTVRSESNTIRSESITVRSESNTIRSESNTIRSESKPAVPREARMGTSRERERERRDAAAKRRK